MLGLTAACLGLLLLALTILATHPTGALQQCRAAYERAIWEAAAKIAEAFHEPVQDRIDTGVMWRRVATERIAVALHARTTAQDG